MNNHDTGWFRFLYKGEERYGLAIGPDTRPRTNNTVMLTDKGVRTFTLSKMENIVNETTVIA